LPNIKAAEKWSRQSEKRAERNRDAKSRLKTLYKKAATTADGEFARTVEGAFDKAASKGIVHRNKAARKKARLATALRKAAAPPAKTAKAKAVKTPRKATSQKAGTGRKTAKKPTQ
jgi:small subunit ribosomal protein S20